MNKVKMLFIRACKCKRPVARVRSVYRRFYGKYDESVSINAINHILCGIVTEYKLLTIESIYSKLHPDNVGMIKDFRTYDEVWFEVLMYAIRFSEYKKFEGLIKPRRFKNECINSQSTNS